MDREQILSQIAEETAACTRCNLQFSRKMSVPGSGPVDAEIMFIGEGPGFHENEQGEPFVGAAGRFLEELLQNIGLSREQVFITNVVKCRPPGNRDPQNEELEACDGYLQRQIQAINPKVIVTLGRFSMQKFLPQCQDQPGTWAGCAGQGPSGGAVLSPGCRPAPAFAAARRSRQILPACRNGSLKPAMCRSM